MTCRKCLGLEHLAAECTGEDRRGVCRRCGEKGHFEKECERAPSCIMCKEASREAGHFLGSKKYAALREEVQGRPMAVPSGRGGGEGSRATRQEDKATSSKA